MSDDKERREFGRVFQRGDVWHIRYCVGGKEYQESARSTDQRKAEKKLDRREAELGAGVFVAPDVKRTTFADLARMIEDDYRVNARRSTRRLTTSLKHLRRFFRGYKALAITTDRVNAYIRDRLEDQAAPASVQNELAALKRAFRLAHRAGKVRTPPYIPRVEVQNTRTGFFEAAEFQALVDALPEDLRPAIRFAYLTGWRIPSEVLPLTWAQVDLQAGVVRLEPGTTKNREGRTFPFDAWPELEALLRVQRERTSQVERASGRVIPWVFHRQGRRIQRFTQSWRTACEEAGTPGMIPHDLRRTAVRNLVRAGVPEKTAMTLTGHKTRAVFDRYNIVNESDLREAVARRAAHTPEGGRKVVPLRRGDNRGTKRRAAN